MDELLLPCVFAVDTKRRSLQQNSLKVTEGGPSSWSSCLPKKNKFILLTKIKDQVVQLLHFYPHNILWWKYTVTPLQETSDLFVAWVPLTLIYFSAAAPKYYIQMASCSVLLYHLTSSYISNTFCQFGSGPVQAYVFLFVFFLLISI